MDRFVEALELWKLCGSPLLTRLPSNYKIAQQTEKTRLSSSKEEGCKMDLKNRPQEGKKGNRKGGLFCTI